MSDVLCLCLNTHVNVRCSVFMSQPLLSSHFYFLGGYRFVLSNIFLVEFTPRLQSDYGQFP
uniref:Uncharacterized protein n=1 Tax=Arion vulgaris TaxID=1028688 RepID=A0A0B7A8F1_9EUPU